jgi:hypothetical protein
MSDDVAEPKGRAKGGIARRDSLDKERRREIASQAAKVRWNAKAHAHLPVAEFGSADRPLRLLDAEIPCYVLSDGTRVLTQQGVLLALGRSRTAKGGTGATMGVDNLPAFLTANNLKPLITKELIASTRAIEFRLPTGGRAFGYAADLLPKVCNVYLGARDRGVLLPSQKRTAEQADMLVRGLAEVGIVAMIDEATGYQQVRARDALQAYLERFIRKELVAWVGRFPDDFFAELYRLRKWRPTGSSRRPGVVGRYIRDLVYERLGPGVIEELEKKNPSDGKGQRKHRHHQWLTDEVGHPALAQHMYALIGFMRAEDDWQSFKHRFDRAFPKRGDTLQLF